MSKLYLLLLVFVALLTISCSNEALRNEEKFSRVKKYALLPFACNDMELSENLIKVLKERLLGDDFQILETEKVDELLARKKLTRQKVAENYTLAIGQFIGFDGIITGNIQLDKKSAEHQVSAQSGGGNISYISSCDVFVIDLTSGEILARANYSTPATVLTTGSQRIDEVARAISLQLSPH